MVVKTKNARGRPRQPLVDRLAIVDAALRIVDSEGAAALSTRRIGKEIGVSGPAIYSYYKNMDAIIFDLVRHVFSDVKAINVNSENWKKEIRTFAISSFDRWMDHQNLEELWRPGNWRDYHPQAEEMLTTLLKRQVVPVMHIDAFLIAWEALLHGFVSYAAIEARGKVISDSVGKRLSPARRQRMIDQFGWAMDSLMDGLGR